MSTLYGMERISSPANALLKDIRKAVAKGGLTPGGLAVAEGIHLLEEALRSRREVPVLVISDRAAAGAEPIAGALPGTRALLVPDQVFETIASTETTQGVMALVKPPEWKIEDVFQGHALVLVLDGVQDPGNAGAMVRAAEAFGASGVVFVKGSVGLWNPKTLRGSAGSLFRVPVVVAEREALRSELEKRPLKIYAAMPYTGTERRADAVDFEGRCAIVVGGEARGVSPELSAIANPVAIPTVGVESLNAAVAAAVLLYEARRQRAPS
jgi:TrmH family RNA methyltransferase